MYIKWQQREHLIQEGDFLGSEFKPTRTRNPPHPSLLHSAFKARQWCSRAHYRRDFLSQLNSDLTFSPALHFIICSRSIGVAGGTRHLLLGILSVHRLMYSAAYCEGWYCRKTACMYFWYYFILCCVTWQCGQLLLPHVGQK